MSSPTRHAAPGHPPPDAAAHAEEPARRHHRRRPSWPTSLSTIPAFCRPPGRCPPSTAETAVAVLWGFKSVLWGFNSAPQPYFVSYHRCDRMLRLIQVHVPAGQPPEEGTQESQAHYRSISALEHIEQYGGMGSVPPPTSTPIWSRVAHVSPIRPGTATGGSSRCAGSGCCLRLSGWSRLCVPLLPAPRLSRPVRAAP